MRRALLSVLLALAALPGMTQAQRLSLRDLPYLVLSKDLNIGTSTQSSLMAYSNYQSQLAQGLPQIDFTPNYRIVYTPSETVQNFSLLQTPPFFSVDQQTITEYGQHSLGAGISLSQLLPTAGRLSLSLSDQMSAWTGSSYTEPQFAQKPSITLSLVQPLLFNGKLIDLEVFPAVFRQAQIGYLLADQDKRAQINQSLRNAIQSFLLIVQLKQNVAQVSKAVDVSQGNLDSLKQNFALGAVTEADVLDARIALSNLKGSLLDIRSNLVRAERGLAHAIGRDDLEGLSLEEDIPAMAFTMPHDEALSALMRNHPTIQRTSLAAEQKKLEDIIAGQSLASNLSLSLSYSPRYPFSSSLTTSYSSDFAHSITDLYGADSGTDFTVTAGLTLHLFDGGRQAADHAAREASIRMAQNSLESQKQALRDQLEVDLLQKANLEEKVPMLSDAVDLAKRRLETETNLFRLGKSTQLNVDSRKADYDAKVNDLWRAKADLLLTAIDLQSLVGGDLVSALEGSSQ